MATCNNTSDVVGLHLALTDRIHCHHLAWRGFPARNDPLAGVVLTRSLSLGLLQHTCVLVCSSCLLLYCAGQWDALECLF